VYCGAIIHSNSMYQKIYAADMTIKNKFLLQYLCLHFACCVLPALACDTPSVLAPAPHERATTVMPNIVWLGSKDATAYDVELLSRVPEGEVLHRIKTTTSGTFYKPNIALTKDTAIVTAIITTRCGAKNSPPVERNFIIDNSEQCPKIEHLETVDDGKLLNLNAKNMNVSFEARIFSGNEAEPHEIAVSRAGSLALPLPAQGVWVAGIRQRCETQNLTRLSEWTWKHSAQR
jgi:hypothetical protein